MPEILGGGEPPRLYQWMGIFCIERYTHKSIQRIMFDEEAARTMHRITDIHSLIGIARLLSTIHEMNDDAQTTS